MTVEGRALSVDNLQFPLELVNGHNDKSLRLGSLLAFPGTIASGPGTPP